MTDNERSHQDQIVDEAVSSVMDKQGVSADEAEVRALAEDAVGDLIDQPVQTFTPLLAENDVLTTLHQRGDAASQARTVTTSE